MKREAMAQRAYSKEDRPFTNNEFKQVVELTPEDRFKAMLNCQFHVAGRCDDTAHVKKEILKANTRFKGCLSTKTSWSKNVHNRTNSPWHTLLPDMNPDTCVHLSLACSFLREMV